MSWWKRSLCSALLVVAVAVPAMAQIGGRPIEASVGGGILNFDARDHVKDAPVYVGTLGWRWTPALTLEAAWLPSMTTREIPAGEPDHTFSWAGADLRWTLRDPSGPAVPYLLTGMGFGRTVGDVEAEVKRGSPSIGMGLLCSLLGNQRTYLRLQVRDILFREGDRPEFSNHIAATAGLQYAFGGKVKDADRDGVRDGLDQCPNTPFGARVDAKGCPSDPDGDGVWTGLDKCENTTKGCKVDRDGCPTDADGDGVCDGIDTCPDTPKGATVDAKGCPSDSDGDGVFDGLDQCANTPKGAKVDDKGCPIDSDGDGVPDGLDQCADTPKGARVDEKGCPIIVTERETELIEQGVIRLQDVNFETAKWDILPESYTILDEVGTLLTMYPTLKIEVGGHTDNVGKPASNQLLSENRAKSVLTYLTTKFPSLDPARFTAKGYGQARPVASNATVVGKAKNRRVEFKVLNLDALKVEREKRKMLMKDGTTAPTDSTQAK